MGESHPDGPPLTIFRDRLRVPRALRPVPAGPARRPTVAWMLRAPGPVALPPPLTAVWAYEGMFAAGANFWPAQWSGSTPSGAPPLP